MHRPCCEYLAIPARYPKQHVVSLTLPRQSHGSLLLTTTIAFRIRTLLRGAVCNTGLSAVSWACCLVPESTAPLRTAAQLRLGNLFGAISEAISSKARTEAAEIVDQLGQLAETFTKQGEESVESENQTLEVASNALAHILRAAQLELERSVIAGKDDHEVREKAQERMEKLVREVERGRGRLEQEALEATHPPTPPQTSMRGPSIAVKWVAADNEGGILRASEEALRVLKDVRESKPLNVLTILGPARRGKSFLMNALTGRGGVFPVSPAAVPCTAGADLSPILMPFSTFERGGRGSIARSSSVSAQPTIAFVDMEGQGDKSTEHGVRLATTFLVISKVNCVKAHSIDW